MYGDDTQPVLRCGQCNKPFDKESTLRRHGYYCRSRRVGATIRLRSCTSCARGKARCDNRRPKCSRCMTKAIDCHYPTDTSKGVESGIQHSDDAAADSRTITASSTTESRSIANFHEMSNGSDAISNSTLVMPDPAFADLGEDIFEWNVPEFDFAKFTDLQTTEDMTQYLASPPSSLSHHSTFTTDQPFQIQQAVSPLKLSMTTSPTHNTRSLVQRPRMQVGGQRSASLMLQTLISYPRMMLRHKTLPPFIHPSSISSIAENDDMEPLNNCINLVNMLSSGSRGVRKLFWRNVRQECERFYEEHLVYNKWELLAAMQALSIYVLIRLDEGETEYNNFDLLLLTAVVAVAKQLNRSDITRNTESTALSDYSLERSWKEWVFEESTRRLCVVYQAVNLLVFFEPAAMCDRPKDLILAPLPAKKQLWEAGDELMWAAATEGETEVQTVFALTTNGDLVKLNKDEVHCDDAGVLLDAKVPTRRTADWGEWYSEMDGFGGLVMLAASLVS